MKKIIIFILVIALAASALYLLPQTIFKKETSNQPTNETGSSSLQPNPSNATFIFDDEQITLSEGRFESTDSFGGAFSEEVRILDKFDYGDINSDNKTDTVLLLARYGAGSGSFVYLAGYVSGPVNYKGTKVFFIGDRVAPQSISIINNVVNVKYLDRAPGEPFTAEPTIPITKSFVYKNGEFAEN
jgi:hypothetical protein